MPPRAIPRAFPPRLTRACPQPSWPLERTADILKEAGASAVVIDVGAPRPNLGTGWAGAFIEVDIECSVVHTTCLAPSGQESFERQSEAFEATMRSADGKAAWGAPEVMYIMYTSGSTGKPKGCIVPTAGVWHRFGWGTSILGFTGDDVFVHKTPSTFDCSIAELWVPLYLGCTSVIVPDGAHLDFNVLKVIMARGRVTVAHFVPSVLSLFLDFVSPSELPHLRQISCTGEALLFAHRRKLTKAMGWPLPLFNLYGPTEASIEVTYFQATDEFAEATMAAEGTDQGGFPIGHAGDDGVLMYVTAADDVSTVLAAGEVGEVCIGGVQVAYGYLERPELSAEKFVPNPHAPGLLYRTGDLGHVDSDGLLRYKGRADRQVKVGGVRMELGEIEAVALSALPSLLNVAVEKVDDKLVGVAAARPGVVGMKPADIKTALAAKLPSSYLPSEWLLRDALPLGARPCSTPPRCSARRRAPRAGAPRHRHHPPTTATLLDFCRRAASPGSAGKVDHKLVTQWIKDQQTAAMYAPRHTHTVARTASRAPHAVSPPQPDRSRRCRRRPPLASPTRGLCTCAAVLRSQVGLDL